MIQKVLTLFSDEDLIAMRSGQIFEASGLNGQTMMFGFDKTSGEVSASIRLALPVPKNKKNRKKSALSHRQQVNLTQRTAEGKRRRFPLSFKQSVVQRIRSGEKVWALSKELHIVPSVLNGWANGRGMKNEAKGA